MSVPVLGQLSFARDSWTAPLDVRRVHLRENANVVAVGPMKRLADHLPAGGAMPRFVFDAGSDAAQVMQGIEELPAAVLVRLHTDRCFHADPPLATPSPTGGRPRVHGAKFACKDATT